MHQTVTPFVVVDAGTPVTTVHVDAQGELVYALGYLNQYADLMRIADADEETTP